MIDRVVSRIAPYSLYSGVRYKLTNDKTIIFFTSEMNKPTINLLLQEPKLCKGAYGVLYQYMLLFTDVSKLRRIVPLILTLPSEIVDTVAPGS